MVNNGDNGQNDHTMQNKRLHVHKTQFSAKHPQQIMHVAVNVLKHAVERTKTIPYKHSILAVNRRLTCYLAIKTETDSLYYQINKVWSTSIA
jgi:hypothetical protein